MNIGFIGAAGGMGRAWVPRFASLGHDVFVSDVNYDALSRQYAGVPNVHILAENKAVAAQSDLLIYSITPLGEIGRVIEDSVGYVREGTIVGGFTSVKTGEVAAFLKHSPKQARIVTMHPMYAPSLPPEGQSFILVPVRDDGNAIQTIEKLLSPLSPKIVYLHSAAEHDKITADTQVLTHFSYFSMGAAWKELGIMPSSHPTYQNPLDDLKSLMAQRLLSQNLDVYTGIAVENPEANRLIEEYMTQIKWLFRYSIRARYSDMSQLLALGKAAAEHLGQVKIKEAKETLEDLLGARLGFEDQLNSHSSLIAKGFTWWILGIDVNRNVGFKSPPYEIMLLLTRAVFSGYEKFLHNMFYNPETQKQDLVFSKVVMAMGGDLLRRDEAAYKRHLEAARMHFPSNQLVEARNKTDELILRLVGRK